MGTTTRQQVPQIAGPHRIKYQQELEDLERSVLGGIGLVLEQLVAAKFGV